MSTTLAPPPSRAPAGSTSNYVTAEEYLRREETAQTKHEWYDGEVREMPGGSLEHSLIANRVSSRLDRAVEGQPFLACNSDIKIRIPDGPYVYADASVAALPPELEPPIRPGGRRTVLCNPVVVVEVLSDSTEDTDRGEKLEGYRRIPSLTDYLLFSQDEPLVEQHRRTGDGWSPLIHAGADATVRLESLGVELRLGDIYSVLDGL